MQKFTDARPATVSDVARYARGGSLMDHDAPGGDPGDDDTSLDCARGAALHAFDNASVTDLFPGVGGIAAKEGLTPVELLQGLAVPDALTLDSGVAANTGFASDLWQIISTLDALPGDTVPGLIAAMAETHFRAYASDPAGVRRILSISAAAMAPDADPDDPDAPALNALRDAFRAATTESYAQMTDLFAAMYEQMLVAWDHKPRSPTTYHEIATVFTALYEGLLLRCMTDDAVDREAAVRLAGLGIRAFMIAMTAELDDDRDVEKLMQDTLGAPASPPAD
jgi:hypothetical protein